MNQVIPDNYRVQLQCLEQTIFYHFIKNLHLPIRWWVYNKSYMVRNTKLLHQFPKVLCKLVASIGMDKPWISIFTQDGSVKPPRYSGGRSIFEHQNNAKLGEYIYSHYKS